MMKFEGDGGTLGAASAAVPDYRKNLAVALFEARGGMMLLAWSDETRNFWLARADEALALVANAPDPGKRETL